MRKNERAVIRKAGHTAPTFLPDSSQGLAFTNLYEAINPAILDEPRFAHTAL